MKFLRKLSTKQLFNIKAKMCQLTSGYIFYFYWKYESACANITRCCRNHNFFIRYSH